MLAKTIPYDKKLPIRILDVGAGYGALTQFLLSYFPKATAVCQDGSKEMAKLGGGRLEFLSTHPAPENRAAKLKELAVKLEPVYVAAKANPPPAQRYVNLK